MAERDKGLELLRGKPLVAWVAERSRAADEVLLSANRNLERYREFGYPVLCDITPDFRGPLAGLYRVLDAAKFPLWLAVPCDTPFLPRDLVARLRAALLEENAEIAVAAAEDCIHPVICLGHAGLRGSGRIPAGLRRPPRRGMAGPPEARGGAFRRSVIISKYQYLVRSRRDCRRRRWNSIPQ